MRDEALLALLIYAGLRVQEACDIQLRDLDLAGSTITIRSGRRDNTTSTGFGSGPARQRHLLFTDTATTKFHFNIDLGSLNKEVEQRQQYEAYGQAEPDLELRLGTSPARPVEVDLLEKLGQNSQKQEAPNPTQQSEIVTIHPGEAEQ